MSDGAEAKEDGADPDEGRGVASLVGSGGAGTGEAEDEVEEKKDRSSKHVDVDSVQHQFRLVAVGLQAGFWRDKSGREWCNVDGKEQEAVENRESAEESFDHRGGLPPHLASNPPKLCTLPPSPTVLIRASEGV